MKRRCNTNAVQCTIDLTRPYFGRCHCSVANKGRNGFLQIMRRSGRCFGQFFEGQYAVSYKVSHLLDSTYNIYISHDIPYTVWEWDASAIDGEDEANVWVVWAVGMPGSAITDHIGGPRQRPNSTTINAALLPSHCSTAILPNSTTIYWQNLQDHSAQFFYCRQTTVHTWALGIVVVRSLINETLQECKTALTLQSLNLFWVIVLKTFRVVVLMVVVVLVSMLVSVVVSVVLENIYLSYKKIYGWECIIGD